MNEWATECATHIFPSKNRNSRTLKICSAPSTWMDGVYRVVRWVMRGFDAADSERTVRPESPTSPNVEIGPTAKNLRTQCSREDCDQGIISSDELDSEEMRRVTVESSLHFLLTLEQHLSMTSSVFWACSEASSANDNNSCTEASHHGMTDSTVVMFCVNVPVSFFFFSSFLSGAKTCPFHQYQTKTCMLLS